MMQPGAAAGGEGYDVVVAAMDAVHEGHIAARRVGQFQPDRLLIEADRLGG